MDEHSYTVKYPKSYDKGFKQDKRWDRYGDMSTSTLRSRRLEQMRYIDQSIGELRKMEKELEDRKTSGFAEVEKRVTSRQVGGDDGYHHAVFVDGRMVMNGLTRTEAEYEKKSQRKRLLEMASTP